MANDKKKVTGFTGKIDSKVRTAAERIVKVTAGPLAGAYLFKPLNKTSSAQIRGPFKGEDAVTKEKFVYCATQRYDKVSGVWTDPVIKQHPEKILEKLLAREKAESELGQDVMSAWRA